MVCGDMGNIGEIIMVKIIKKDKDWGRERMGKSRVIEKEGQTQNNRMEKVKEK